MKNKETLSKDIDIILSNYWKAIEAYIENEMIIDVLIHKKIYFQIAGLKKYDKVKK